MSIRAYSQATAWLLLVFVGNACDDKLPEPPLEAAPGRVEVLDAGGTGGDTGWWPSVVFDKHDQPHLAYCDARRGDLRYATREAGSWHTETVVSKGAVGKYAALALSPDDRPAIAFYDQDRKLLRYAYQQGDGTWQTERVAWGLEAGIGSQLRFDARGTPHLFYYLPNGKFVHATREDSAEGPTWHRKTVADALGGYSASPSVRLRSDGFWIAFVDWNFVDTKLLLAQPKGDGSLSIEHLQLERGAGWHTFLAFLGAKPRVLYSVSLAREIRWAWRKAGKWKSQRLIADGGNFAAAQDASGNLAIVYEDIHLGQEGLGTLKYMRQSGKSWRRFRIDDEGPVGDYMAIALDSRGRPLIAYHSRPLSSLKIYDETTPSAAPKR